MKRALTLLTAFLIGGVLTTHVNAGFIDISFSTTGVDQFTLAPSVDQLRIDAQASTSLHLIANSSAVETINNLYFSVGDSGSLVGDFPFSLNRSMTISTDTQSLAQNGTLRVTLAADQFLVMDGAPPMTFHFAEGDVTVTPLSLRTDGFGVGGSGNYDMKASFLFTPVPEPTTMLAGALLLLPFGATTLRVLRRNRAA